MKQNWSNFKNEIVITSNQFDVIGVCETRLTKGTERVYKLDGYNMFTCNVSSKNGGVGLYISKKYSAKTLIDMCFVSEYLEALFVEVHINKNKTLIIGMLYRRSGTVVGDFMHKMEEILVNIDKKKCLMMGDFNLNLLESNTNDVVSDYISLFNQFSFNPTIIKPTRVTPHSATIIDQIWVNFTDNRDSNGAFTQIIISDITDHFPCSIHVNIKRVRIFRSV